MSASLAAVNRARHAESAGLVDPSMANRRYKSLRKLPAVPSGPLGQPGGATRKLQSLEGYRASNLSSFPKTQPSGSSASLASGYIVDDDHRVPGATPFGRGVAPREPAFARHAGPAVAGEYPHDVEASSTLNLDGQYGAAGDDGVNAATLGAVRQDGGSRSPSRRNSVHSQRSGGRRSPGVAAVVDGADRGLVGVPVAAGAAAGAAVNEEGVADGNPTVHPVLVAAGQDFRCAEMCAGWAVRPLVRVRRLWVLVPSVSDVATSQCVMNVC